MKAGDVVELKSGGPDLTIELVLNDGRCQCVWWNRQTEKFEERLFRVEALTPRPQSGR